MMVTRTTPSASRLAIANDENAVVSNNKHGDTAVGNTTKTPKSNKTRRAFGDISNRKTGRTEPPLKSIAIQNSSSHSIQNNYTQNTTKATATAKRNKNIDMFPKKRVNFAIPSNDLSIGEQLSPPPKALHLEQSNLSTKESTNNAAFSVFDEEVETPSGRLWIDNRDFHFDDETAVSLEGAATAGEDLLAILNERHENRLAWEDEKHKQVLKMQDEKEAEFIENISK